MKKNIISIVCALALSLALSLCVFATEDSAPAASVTKDGITAELYLLPVNETEISASVSVALAEDAANISNISVELTIADELVLTSGEALTKLNVAPGESQMLYYTLVNRDAVETVGSTPVTEELEAKGCGAIVSGTAVIFALIMSVFFIAKNPKRGAAFMFACLMILPLAFSAGAVTTERKINLEGTVGLDGTEYPVTALITYDHSFTEQKSEGTDGMEKFEITYYWGPQGQDLCNEEYIKKIAECGFTSIPVEGYDPTINKTALGYLRKYGMTCSGIADYRILNALAISDQTAIDAYIQDIVNDYKDYLDVIKAWWIKDEPSATDFPALGRVVDAIHRIDPERKTMINLFPTYASDTQLATKGYQQYLDQFISVVNPDYISYDHYHFQKTQARKGFFENIEIIRDTAIANGLDPMLIILLTEHMSYADLTKYQVEWEVNMCLTYGMKRVSYFTYWLSQDLLDQGWSNACMDTQGKIYPHYYDVQEINKWLLPLGTELFDKTSTAVFHTRSKGGGSLEKGCERYTSYGDLGEVDADASVVIGFFDDGSFMITNKMYTDTENSRNTVRFLDVASGLEYFDTVSASWKDAEADGIVTRNENGILCRTFEPGAGMLFRVKGK
ncbi:MAG: hypothetical protein J6S71_09145 [Clostridia bacterium]|nr:hypothetical protein [Clostridia bacterium]